MSQLPLLNVFVSFDFQILRRFTVKARRFTDKATIFTKLINFMENLIESVNKALHFIGSGPFSCFLSWGELFAKSVHEFASFCSNTWQIRSIS